MLGAGGSDPETAIAHDHGRDAMPAGRGQIGIPQHLRVVVRMAVDESRGQDQAVEINHVAHPPGLAGVVDRHDRRSLNDHIGPTGGSAGAVHDTRTTKHRHGEAPRWFGRSFGSIPDGPSSHVGRPRSRFPGVQAVYDSGSWTSTSIASGSRCERCPRWRSRPSDWASPGSGSPSRRTTRFWPRRRRRWPRSAS